MNPLWGFWVENCGVVVVGEEEDGVVGARVCLGEGFRSARFALPRRAKHRCP